MPSPNTKVEVPRIPGERHRYGILSECAVPVVPATRPHELNGTRIHGQACDLPDWWQDCPEEGSFFDDREKEFQRVDSCTFDPVTVYYGAECSSFGVSQDELEQAALNGLARGEQVILERFVHQFVLCHEAENLMGDTMQPAAFSVGMLEDWLARNYGGRGILHVPVMAAAYLAQRRIIQLVDGCYQTAAGNDVVIGGGYANGVVPAEGADTCGTGEFGESWLYISPPMRIRRDSTELFGSPGESLDKTTNDRRVIAETTFVPELACCKAAARPIDLTA